MKLINDNGRYMVVSDDYTKIVEVGSKGSVITQFNAEEGEKITFFSWKVCTPREMELLKTWVVVREVAKMKAINRYFEYVNNAKELGSSL